jgi:hypothetical protein
MPRKNVIVHPGDVRVIYTVYVYCPYCRTKNECEADYAEPEENECWTCHKTFGIKYEAPKSPKEKKK